MLNMKGKKWEQLKKESVQAGFLYYPYHYFIDDKGLLHSEREDYTVSNCENFDKNAVHVLVDNLAYKRMSNKQKKTLIELEKILKDRYEGAKVIVREEI